MRLPLAFLLLVFASLVSFSMSWEHERCCYPTSHSSIWGIVVSGGKCSSDLHVLFVHWPIIDFLLKWQEVARTTAGTEPLVVESAPATPSAATALEEDVAERKKHIKQWHAIGKGKCPGLKVSFAMRCERSDGCNENIPVTGKIEWINPAKCSQLPLVAV